jgi:2-oxoglutarate dehydrogenase E1 component
MDKYSYISNAHGAYIDDLYKTWQADPESVDESWRKFFEGFEFSLHHNGENGNGQYKQGAISVEAISPKEICVRNLIHAYRTRGHLRSKTNPVRNRRDRKALLDLSDFQLGEEDLDTEFDVGNVIGIGRATLRDIYASLKKIYEGPIGFEYMYIREPDVLAWLKEKIETDFLNFNPAIEEKKRILSKLNEAVVFENFLHTKYIGQKRFSLEGGETTIPALDAIINKGAELGAVEFKIGMAHRGRLNVLANVLGKTYVQIFNEFEGNIPSDMTMGDGDVKYHLGFKSTIITAGGKEVRVNLMPNPSHLEAVNPLVIGVVRAKADLLYKNEYHKIVPILIHGDAAIAGQGIIYEVVQMSNLKGYHTGGTIHFVINNQLGFTTNFDDARSSIYCTDVAEIVDAPVLHVNGDDPEAVIFCMNLAMEFRQKFHRDIFIDMVCYRRHGHNENDEPKFTQPSLYNIISKHPNPREVYNKKLIERGEVDAELAAHMDEEFRSMLQDRLMMVKQHETPYLLQPLEREWKQLRSSRPADFDQSPETGISNDVVNKVGKALVKIPQGFKPLRQVEKLLKERKKMFFEDKALNWAAAELLAYGSILLKNQIVRVSGQDSVRGTFSHRHAVLFDAETDEPYSSLDHINKNQQPMRIFNSLLSEFGVLGFDLGYAMANPHALVVWEAQFGDFANGAQVIIDQFISCSETKWQRMNGLVMLLPHGYEGQGPEHSSARIERFLQLSADYNMIVANITTPANFFHALRRQLTWPFRKPLVVMSPKSLLRHPKVISPLNDFTEGRFREIMDDAQADPDKIKRLVLCTGKIYYELIEEKEKQNREDIAIVRYEQLHPLPVKQEKAIFEKYNKAKIFWVQEEPSNMGCWSYMLRTHPKLDIELISRRPSASPAIGYARLHAKEQEEIIQQTFSF